jgi:hypothetical protein
MADDELEDATIVPLTSETEEERRRIRASNDRDQQREREGKTAPHNQGYDAVADAKQTPDIEDVVAED